MPTVSWAQDATSAPIPEVTITGSAIKGNPDVAGANPITVITAKEIARTGATTAEQLLDRIPSIGSQGLNSAVASNFGGNGFSNVELRNLGPQRTLVLIDGNRVVQSANGGAFNVDFNNIPVDMIDKIEILRDGASPIYGSDAVAGVINIILKKNYNGAQVSAYVGATDHIDASTYKVDGLIGHNWDKGNVTMNFGYEDREPLFQRDRFWAGNYNGSAVSGYLAGGHFEDDATGGGLANIHGLGNGTFDNNTGPFDTSKTPNLFASLENKNFGVQAHYNLTPDIVASAQFTYDNRFSENLANPDPFFLLTQAFDPATGIGVKNTGLAAGTPIDFFGRLFEIGPRTFDTTVNTYRAVFALDGTLFDKFDWKFSYNHGVSDAALTTDNLVNQGPTGTNGNFGASTFTGDLNQLTNADLAKLRLNTTDQTHVEENVFHAEIQGPVVELPAGPLQFIVGTEYRTEAGYDHPDSANVAGYTDQSGLNTQGNYSVAEAFAELNVPLVKDEFLIKELSVNGAARYSNYSNFGDAETWKSTVKYKPIDDLTLRSTASTAFRAPSIGELFLGQLNSFTGPSDPCDTNPASGSLTTTAPSAVLAANCAAALHAANAAINPATYSSFTAQQQIVSVVGGNPKLQPETSRGLTIGATWEPKEFVPNFSFTIDYFRVKVANAIGSDDPQSILNTCYTSVGLSNAACKFINGRVSAPNSVQPTIGGINTINDFNVNGGSINTDGIDFDLGYGFDLDQVGLTDWGHIDLRHLATFTRTYDTTDPVTGNVVSAVGLVSSTSGSGPLANAGGYPELKSVSTVSWSRGDWQVEWTAHFIEGLANYNNPGSTAHGDTTPDVWYHDLEVGYTLDNITFMGGVQNLFDLKPPYFADTVGRTNSNPFVYGDLYMGRFVWLRTTAKF